MHVLGAASHKHDQLYVAAKKKKRDRDEEPHPCLIGRAMSQEYGMSHVMLQLSGLAIMEKK